MEYRRGLCFAKAGTGRRDNTFAVHTFYQGLIGNGCVSGHLRQMLWLELYPDGEEVLVTTSMCGKMQEISDYSLELPLILAWTYALDGYLDFFRA